MAPTSLSLAGKKFTAAKPWAGVPQATLDRTVFFHHRTGTANHGELGRVLQLFGALRRGQWLPTLLREEPADLPELRADAAGHHWRRAAVVRRPVPAQGDADGLEGGPLRAEGPAGHAAGAARRHAEQAERGPQGEPRADHGRAGVPRQHGPRAVRPADDDPAGGDGFVDHHGRRRHQSGDGGGAADQDERRAGGDDPPAVLGRQPHRQQLCRARRARRRPPSTTSRR